MTTLDFELEISGGEVGNYSVVARGPSGEAATTVRWPLAPAELDHQLLVIKDKVLVSSTVIRRAPTEYEQPVRQLGQRLFQVVIADEVLALYVASRQRARANGDVLRLVLRVQPPELARLPWEYLFDPSRDDYLGLTAPLVRYLQVLAPRQPLRVPAPLRILGMVARPDDQQALDAADEQQRLHAALAGLQHDGLVELKWVAGQTYSALEDALDQGPWHVFHFVGHGGYDAVGDEGILALADETGRTDPVGADDISRLLAEHHSLRLVVLNACDSGRGSVSDAFSSTAAALIRREVPAVVAMQFEITDSAAIRFAETFYQHVAKGRSVDDSVMRARRAVRMANRNSLEWGTPVLYLRAPDGRIFDVTDLPTMQPISSSDPVPYRTVGVRAVLESASEIDRNTKQEDVSPLLHRIFVEHNRSAINVKIPDRDVWLGFGTFPHHQFGENLNVIYIYYYDPDSVEKASLDTFVNWGEGRSIDEALNRIRNVLRQNPARRQAANFNANEIIAELKRKTLEITG